jgi:Metallopeptidase toxin 3
MIVPLSKGDAMKMNAQDIKAFPKFAKYVSTSLPGLANVKPIISAIESISEFGDAAAIKAALSWGHGPMVEVKILVDKQVGRQVVSPRAGYTPHTNIITMRQRDVLDYENDRDLRKTHNGHTVHIVGVQLLHELTHWAREQAGKGEDEDLGFVFEKEIYGGIVTD